jgi:hypothetical protein
MTPPIITAREIFAARAAQAGKTYESVASKLAELEKAGWTRGENGVLTAPSPPSKVVETSDKFVQTANSPSNVTAAEPAPDTYLLDQLRNGHVEETFRDGSKTMIVIDGNGETTYGLNKAGRLQEVTLKRPNGNIVNIKYRQLPIPMAKPVPKPREKNWLEKLDNLLFPKTVKPQVTAKPKTNPMARVAEVTETKVNGTCTTSYDDAGNIITQTTKYDDGFKITYDDKKTITINYPENHPYITKSVITGEGRDITEVLIMRDGSTVVLDKPSHFYHLERIILYEGGLNGSGVNTYLEHGAALHWKEDNQYLHIGKEPPADKLSIPLHIKQLIRKSTTQYPL